MTTLRLTVVDTKSSESQAWMYSGRIRRTVPPKLSSDNFRRLTSSAATYFNVVSQDSDVLIDTVLPHKSVCS